MPKGGLLHAHLDATVNASFLLDLALKQPALHVRVSERVTSTTIVSLLPEFKALAPTKFSSASSVTDASYVPGSWVSIRNARKFFDSSLGGPDGFDKWVIGAITINPTEAYNTHNTIEKARVLPCSYISTLTSPLDMAEVRKCVQGFGCKSLDFSSMIVVISQSRD